MARRCPIYALAPVKPLGLQPESFSGAFLALLVLKPIIDLYGAILVGVIIAVVSEKLAKKGTPGFVLYWLSSRAWMAQPSYLLSLSSSLARLFNSVWTRIGSMPIPSYQSKYEP